MGIESRFVTHERKVFFELAAEYVKEKDKVLDIGCGDGSFAEVLGRKDVRMLDSNEETCAALKAAGYTHVRHGKADKLPYSEGAFDVVHCSHLVEHLTAEEVYRLMKECRRVIKPGGKLIISAPMGWEGFWNDLSHVRPYNASMFLQYLVKDNPNHSRKLVGGFTYVRTVYRYRKYRPVTITEQGDYACVPETLVEKTGYTLVLERLGKVCREKLTTNRK